MSYGSKVPSVYLPASLNFTQVPVGERPQFGSQESSHSLPQLHAWEASSSSQKNLGASLGPRANYPTSSKVSRGLGNLQGDYRR